MVSFTPQPRYPRVIPIGYEAGREARAGPDDMERPGLELRALGRPARSQSLYRLRYPGCQLLCVYKRNYIEIVGAQ
jgi:hypothetical protein